MKNIRSHFEKNVGITTIITTIAPTPLGKSLTDDGWRFVTRDSDGIEISSANADGKRKEILRSFGHKL